MNLRIIALIQFAAGVKLTMWGPELKSNKKVFLRECKRHTICHVASICCSVPVRGTPAS